MLQAIADGYKKIESAELRTYAVSEIFGKSGAKIGTLLDSGSKELKKTIESYVSVFDDDSASKAEKFNDDLLDFNKELRRLKVSEASELFPAFSKLFSEITFSIKDNANSLKQFFSSVSKFISLIIPQISVFAKAIVWVLDSIGPVGIL